MKRDLGGVGLPVRMRSLERVEFGAAGIDRDERRHPCQIAGESARVEELRNEDAIGHRRRIAEQEAPARPFRRDKGLEPHQPVLDPVPVPVVDHRLIVSEIAFQVAQHAKVRERMDVASDQQGQ